MSIFFQTVMDAVRQAVKDKFDGNISQASQYWGISYDNLHKWLRGDRIPTLEKISPILDSIGKFTPDAPQAVIRRISPHAPLKEADSDDSVAINVYALAGAGPGFELEEGDPLATIRIPPDYAMRCDCAVMVKGDSMAWTIKNGGIVGIMRKSFDFISGEVYAVRLPYEGLSIKRVIVDTSAGEYIIRSDNPDKEKYPDRRLPIMEEDNIIFGRVIWVWQTI